MGAIRSPVTALANSGKRRALRRTPGMPERYLTLPSGYSPPCQYVSSDIASGMAHEDKPLVWFHGEVHTPPFSVEARIETGVLLRRLQRGENLSLPHSRPMPSIGSRCHELRVRDETQTWRIIYRVDSDAIVIVEVFGKTTQQTPKRIVDASRRRLQAYDRIAKGKDG